MANYLNLVMSLSARLAELGLELPPEDKATLEEIRAENHKSILREAVSKFDTAPLGEVLIPLSLVKGDSLTLDYDGEKITVNVKGSSGGGEGRGGGGCRPVTIEGEFYPSAAEACRGLGIEKGADSGVRKLEAWAKAKGKALVWGDAPEQALDTDANTSEQTPGPETQAQADAQAEAQAPAPKKKGKK